MAALLASLLVLALLTLPAPGYAVSPSGDSAPTLSKRSSWLRGWAHAPRAVPAGAVYAARIRVSGGSRSVLLQRRVDDTWRTVHATRSDRAGRAAVRWRAPRTSTRAVLRVFLPNSRVGRAAMSRSRLVTVRVRKAGAPSPAPGGGSPSPSSPSSDGLSPRLREVLALVNQARSSARSCGSKRFPAVPPVRVDARLNRAAAGFARTMAERNFFSHSSPDGASPGDRIDAAGYRWRSYGENIAGGHETPAAVVQGWLDSPGHCENLMGDYRDIGLGYAENPDALYQRYWVQDFASR